MAPTWHRTRGIQLVIRQKATNKTNSEQKTKCKKDISGPKNKTNKKYAHC